MHSSPVSQSKASLLIDQFVQAAVSSNLPAYRVLRKRSGGEEYITTSLGVFLFDVSRLLNVYADQYEYSECLQIFQQACSDIGLEHSASGATCLDESGTSYLCHPKAMNRLVEQVRVLAQEGSFKRYVADRRYQSGMNATRVEHYVRGVLVKYSRTVVVRIDLSYLKVVQHRLRIEHVYKDLKALIRQREKNSIFKHETGYIWSVEQGGVTGSFHIHMAFFFNSAQVRSDWTKGNQIGQLWRLVTGGLGCYHVCNSTEYKDLGIGTVRRDQPHDCDNVVKAIRYLTKEDQYLRIKPVGARTLGMGRLKTPIARFTQMSI